MCLFLHFEVSSSTKGEILGPSQIFLGIWTASHITFQILRNMSEFFKTSYGHPIFQFFKFSGCLPICPGCYHWLKQLWYKQLWLMVFNKCPGMKTFHSNSDSDQIRTSSAIWVCRELPGQIIKKSVGMRFHGGTPSLFCPIKTLTSRCAPIHLF